MAILNQTPLTMEQVKSLMHKSEERRPVDDYLKTFSKKLKEKPEKIFEEINALNNPKIKDVDIIKVIDLKPIDKEDLNKIFNEVSLDEDEANKILEIIKKY